MKSAILYTLARIAVFVVPFVVLYGIGLSYLWAAVIAAAVGFLLSYILLGRLRTGVATSIERRRAVPEHDEDSDIEDAVLDGADGSAATVRPAPARRSGPPAEDD
ncbi:DUF4229 domain-containing protein [Frondihabitans australicus]|uniref:Uncharacterized protein DUF4229 n=1 Tax=Frondihabitans australicus TaxID=386892 RepID=A0A495IDI1_9MICO|nr:DUF4229 domain-containing protein [Frondihabitans australicus]RKR73066.1 uncharacterized protein DUF4229 [Frondihabitans australicus]